MRECPFFGRSTSRTSWQPDHHTSGAAHRAQAKQTEFDRAMALAGHFGESSRPHASTAPTLVGEGGKGGRAFMPGMRCVSAISICARLRTILVRPGVASNYSVIVERTGTVARVEASLALIPSHWIIESARIGAFFCSGPNVCFC